MRAGRRAHAIALERDADRRGHSGANATALGVPDLDLRDARGARGPDGASRIRTRSSSAADPGTPELLIAVERLRPGGRLVAHSVTLGSEAACCRVFTGAAGSWCDCSCPGETARRFLRLAAAMPVTQVVEEAMSRGRLSASVSAPATRSS